MEFFHTTEFYVILFVIAASAVAVVVRPTSTVAVREFLLAGKLCGGDGDVRPRIEIAADDAGNLYIARCGLSGLTSSGAVSLKVDVKGFDIMIYERLTPGNPADEPVDRAEFMLDFLASERYHLHYESESTSMSASLNFRNVTGLTMSCDLAR